MKFIKDGTPLRIAFVIFKDGLSINDSYGVIEDGFIIILPKDQRVCEVPMWHRLEDVARMQAVLCTDEECQERNFPEAFFQKKNIDKWIDFLKR